MPKTAKKKAAKKRGRKPGSAYKLKLPNGYAAAELTSPVTLAFEIETSPPPIVTGSKFKTLDLTERVKATVPNLKPGQAFIVPGYKSTTGVRNVLNKLFPEHLFICQLVSGSKDKVRVYFKR